MVVSLIALSIAVGGSATAATTLITGRQIKDGTVAKADLTPSLRQQINARPRPGLPGLTGLTGPPGLPGLTGPPGIYSLARAPGRFDPAKVTYVVGPSTTMNPGAIVTVQAFCPAGTKAIGGGYFSIGFNASSATIPGGSGWQVLILNDTGIVTTTNSAFAVCAAP